VQTDIDLLSHYPPFYSSLASEVQQFHLCYLRGTTKDDSIIYHHVRVPKAAQRKSLLILIPIVLHALKVIRRHEVNLIYLLDGSQYELIALLLSKITGIPYVLRIRTHSEKIRSAVGHNKLRKFLALILTRIASIYASHVVCLSNEIKKMVLNWGVKPEKVSVIYHGVDSALFKPKKTKKPFQNTVLFTGGVLRKEKGAWMVFEVAKRLPNVHFLIMGQGCKPTSTKNVHILSEVPHIKMPDFYNMADLVLLPSETEGFGDVVLEALASGKPIIVSKVSDLPYLISSKFGWLFDVGNIDQLEEKIEEAFSNKAQFKKMGEQAREFAKTFNWSNFSQDMVSILHNCTEAG